MPFNNSSRYYNIMSWFVCLFSKGVKLLHDTFKVRICKLAKGLPNLSEVGALGVIFKGSATFGRFTFTT